MPSRKWSVRARKIILIHSNTLVLSSQRKIGRGAIVNMSSVSGCRFLKLFPKPHRTLRTDTMIVLGGNPGLIYPTSKGAIIQMTRAMAAHHGKENIRVNCVAPGMVFTPLVRGRGMTDEMRKARVGQNLMGIEGTGWDVGYGTHF